MLEWLMDNWKWLVNLGCIILIVSALFLYMWRRDKEESGRRRYIRTSVLVLVSDGTRSFLEMVHMLQDNLGCKIKLKDIQRAFEELVTCGFILASFGNKPFILTRAGEFQLATSNNLHFFVPTSHVCHEFFAQAKPRTRMPHSAQMWN